MNADRVVLALLTGVVAALAIGVVRAHAAFQHVQDDGVFVTMPVLGRQHVKPPSGGGDTLELTPRAREALSEAPTFAIGAGVVAAAVVLMLPRGS